MSAWRFLIKTNQPNADSLPVPLLVCIKFRGSVTDVTAAVEAGMEVANRMTGVVQHYVIPNPEEGTEKNAEDQRPG